MCAAGLAWFIGNFAVVDLPAIAWIGGTAPSSTVRFWRTQSSLSRAGGLSRFCGAAWSLRRTSSCLWPALATSDAASMALGAAVLVVTVLNGPAAACTGVAFALAVVGVAAVAASSRPLDQTAVLRFYEAALLVTGCVLVVALARWKSALVDRVVELGDEATVRDALRRVLGDPSLEVGFRGDASYIDERGQSARCPRLPDGA